jgi:hypothetical protein
MNRTSRALLAGGLALLFGTPSLAGTLAQREFNFDVLLDGKPIGSHEFRITDGSETRKVETSASFDVSILFVTVFRYRHSNTEVWQDGCLQRIASETDSNGNPYRVTLDRASEGYRVTTLDDSVTYPVDCMMTFAYWDRRFLEQPRLLNSQTGELIEVQVQPLGTGRPEWLPVDAPVEGYRIVAESQDVDIRIFYNRLDGRWVALESLLESGRVMRYLPSEAAQRTAHPSPPAATSLES